MKTHEELCKSGEIHGSEYDRRGNPTIKELEDAIATGKHVDLKPDGTATISDKKPRPTIDQVLAEVGDKHNQPLSADMMGKACAAAANVLDTADEKPLGDGEEIITNETIYRMVCAALMVVAYEKAQPVERLAKTQPFESCPELTPWIERLANSPMPMTLIDWSAFVDAINTVAADASRYRSLSKQFWHHVSEKPASRGCYLCRMKEDESIVYQDLKYDDGWYGQGYRSITHWAEIPMLLWGK